MKGQMILKTKEYSRRDNKHYEGAMTQGNGYLNVRASFEEDLDGEAQNEHYWRLPANVTLEKIRNPVTKWGIYVPGIYGKHPMLGEELVNLPYFLGLNLYCDGERFDMENSNHEGYEKTLDMEDGVLQRKLRWKTGSGKKLDIIWRRYLSMAFRHSAVQEVVIRTDRDAEVEVESFLDGEVTTNGYDHFVKLETDLSDGLEMYLEVDSGQHVTIGSEMEIDTVQAPVIRQEGRRISETYRIALKKETEIKFKKVSTVVTDRDEESESEDLKQELKRQRKLLGQCQDEFRLHQQEWEHLWENADVEIQGDDELQFHLRFSIYHLLRAANQSGKVAIDAKGYAGEAYFGHYFWDTEMYLLPFYIYTDPRQAKRLVEYRYHTLEGARKNALRYGYQGARYPWESCISGEEQCPNWQYADLEIHVTADVVYGLLEYCHLSGDKRFLEEKGSRILLETARYWRSRVREKDGKWHLEGVMGPDEYLPFTRDNAYTNYLAAFALQKTAEILGALPRKKQEELGIREGELLSFREISRNMYFPYDGEKDFIWQSADFEEYEDIDFDQVWKDRSVPFGNCISQEHNYRCKALKQGDTVMLFYLFRDSFPETLRKRCTDYYETITTHDSSLSYIIHSLVYGDLGEKEKSYDYAVKSMKLDWENKGAAEGIHIANAGGLWQGVVCGFGGLCGIGPDGCPKVEPKLPDHITRITYPVCLSGKKYRVTVEKDAVEIKECG